MGVQHLNWQIAAFDTCRALFYIVGDVCFNARPVDTGSGQVHCLVDAGVASVEVYHDAVSARWWDDHSFTLGEEVAIDGELVSEAPVKSGCSGDMTLSLRPTIQGKPVHCQEDWIPLCLSCNLGEMSLGEGIDGDGVNL